MDSGWIKALELPAKITGGLFLACGVIWLLDQSETLNLDEIAPWVRPLVIVLWAGSGCLFAATLAGDAWAFGAALFKKRAEKTALMEEQAAQEKAAQEKQEAALKYLDQLSEKENYEAAKALKGNSPSFESWAHATGTGQLIAKGLIYSPQGTYNQDHFPFTFYDFAWEALQERRDTILAKEAEYEAARKKRR